MWALAYTKDKGNKYINKPADGEKGAVLLFIVISVSKASQK